MLTDQHWRDRRVAVLGMNPSQRRAHYRLWRYYRDAESYSGCTSIRYKVEPLGAKGYAVVLETRRSDCDPASPRAIICHRYAQAFIGPRGGIKIAIARMGIGKGADEKAHVAKMVRGKVARR